MNTVICTGRITADPEVKVTTTGKSFVRFKMALDRKFKREGDPTADFPSFVAWGKTADLIGKYISKGTLFGVEGRLVTGSYEKNGQKFYTTEVYVESVEFLEKKKQGQESGSDNVQAFNEAPSEFEGFSAIDEDIPF